MKNKEWHHIDAKDQVLGRIATSAASLLLGKHRTDSREHTAAPVFVVITNTDKVHVTGKKREQKMYRSHSKYPGSLKERTLGEQMRRDSTFVVRQAVAGMLPKNNLRAQRLLQLKLYAGPENPHAL